MLLVKKSESRISETQKAHEIIKGEFTLLQSDLHKDSAVKSIEKMIYKEEPDILISHWKDDSHPEHRRIFELVSQALIWPWIYNKSPKYFFSVDTYSSQGMSSVHPADYIVDISEVWDTKIKMISCFESQPTEIWKEMVRKQNEYYGERIESAYAEAFIQNPIQGKKIMYEYLPIII